MVEQLKKTHLKNILKKRKLNSHKGENGKLLIIGGSIERHGPPILAAHAALRSGLDKVSIYVPESNFDVTRASSLDFIVKKYPGEFLTERYVNQILEYSKNFDAVLIGPGLGKNEKSLNAVKDLIKNIHKPIILDSFAIMVLKKIEKFPLDTSLSITPHRNEFKNLVDRDLNFKIEDPKNMIVLRSIAMDLHINMLIKGFKDFMVSEEGDIFYNTTGNPGMTVLGTGDVLAGMFSALISQKYNPFDAMKLSTYKIGCIGDKLKRKYGYNFLASDFIDEIAKTLK